MFDNIRCVAVDFDGTLFEEDYPNIGAPLLRTIEYVKKLKAAGIELILYTNREGKLLEEALSACKEYGIEFDAVNENLKCRTEMYGNDCRKIGADMYIDDKAINPNIDPILLSDIVYYTCCKEDSSDETYGIPAHVEDDAKWVDSVGGIHEDGCGWAPNGDFCGECSNKTCENCFVWNRKVNVEQ